MPVPLESSSGRASHGRLRWHARRGLLENDLLLKRFFDRYEAQLQDDEVYALERLLALGDGELLDLILQRCELGETADPASRRVLDMLRSA